MKLTQEWIKEQFVRFNGDYFGGALPRPRFGISHGRTRLGTLTFRWKEVRNGLLPTQVKRVPHSHVIRLSDYYEQSERDYQNTLLHEMIHLYISVNLIEDTSSHGKVFTEWMEKLNKLGWNITIREKGILAAANPEEIDMRVVLAIVTMNGQCYFATVNPRYVGAVDRRAAVSSIVKSHRWFFSSDPFFSSYPQSRTLRGVPIDKKIFEEKIKTMKPLEL